MRINVRGAIVPNNDKWVYDMLDMDATSPKDVVDALPSTNEDVEVIINSGGGDVFSGSEIYTALKSHNGNVNIKVVGVAASAASIIAMAGTHIEMSPTALMMIHNAQTEAAGDNRTMARAQDMLTTVNQSATSAYALKTGKSQQELLDLMNDETWFNADTAIEHGFADSKMFEESAPKLVANAGQMLSNETIQKISTSMNQTPKINVDIDQIANKVIEKLEAKQKEESPKPENNSGYGRFLF